MKIATIVAACALALSATAAVAGGTVQPAETAPVIAPSDPAHDWSGVYVGGYAIAMSPVGFSDTGFYDDDPWDETHGHGLFIGYNFQNGALVYGGELTYTFYDGENENFANEFLEDIIELRGRVGYAMDNVLLYGTLGVSVQQWSTSPTFDFELYGHSVGFGIDYAINESWIIGGEIAYRRAGNIETNGFDDDQIIVREPSIRLRAGFSF